MGILVRDEQQAKLDNKLSPSDVNPTIVKLHEDLALTRIALEKSTGTALKGGAMLQSWTSDVLKTLNKSVHTAYGRLK